MLLRASAFGIWDTTWRFCAFVAAAARARTVERNDQRERQEQKFWRDRRGKAFYGRKQIGHDH